MRRSFLVGCLIFLTSFAVISAMSQDIPRRDLDRFDQAFYLSIAYDLHRHGVYSDGVYGKLEGVRETPEPGMFIGPAYPALLWLVMKVDPAFAHAAECMLLHRKSGEVRSRCTAYTSIVFPLHRALWAGTVTLIWLVAGAALGPAASWLAAGIALVAACVNLNITHWVMTESLSVFVVTAHGTLLFFALRGRSIGLAALAGAALGLLTLTRPSNLYLFWAYLGLAILAGVALRSLVTRTAIYGLAAFAAGFGTLVLPWCLRNFIQLGAFGLTHRYGAHVLMERVSFNQMTSAEWLASFVYWIPRFGDDLAKWLFGEQLVRRLNWNLPESFYLQGLARRAQLPHDQIDAMMPQLLSQEVLGNLGQHLLVTLSLFWNGMMVYGHLGLIFFPFLVAFVVSRIRQKDLPILAFVLPPVFMNALHAAVATNQPRYNLALIASISVAGAWGLAAMARRFGRRQASAASARPAPIRGPGS